MGRSAFAPCLIHHDDAGRDAGAVKQVGRQADDAFDIALPDDVAADIGLGIAPEQYAVGQNDRALAGAFEGFDDVQQKGIVAVFLGRLAIFKPLKWVVRDIDPAAPDL